MERKIKILKGRGKIFDIFIRDEKGNPKSIVGWSLIRFQMLISSGALTKYAPLDAGVDEIQTLDLKGADAGSFKLKYKNETTASLDFDSLDSEIQTALNALKELSGVVVADQGGGVFTITFSGNDGSRAHDLILVQDSTLELAGESVVATLVETQVGSAENGIEVVDESCGHLRVKLSEEDVDLLSIKNDQSVDLYVRIGTQDLDLDTELFRGIIDVIESC